MQKLEDTHRKDIGSNSSSQMCQLSSQRTTLPEFSFLCGFQVRVDHKGSVLEVWKVEVKWQPTFFKGLRGYCEASRSNAMAGSLD